MNARVRAELIPRLQQWAQLALRQPRGHTVAPDVHIDLLHRSFRSRSNWVCGALVCLDVLRTIRDSLRPTDTVCAVLHVTKRHHGLALTMSAIAKQLAETPPEVVWLRAPLRARYLATIRQGSRFATRGASLRPFEVYYYEHERPSGEHSRTVWIVSIGEVVRHGRRTRSSTTKKSDMSRTACPPLSRDAARPRRSS